MARKNSIARIPGLVPVRLDIPPIVRDRLRVLAAGQGIPMSEFVRDLVVKEVEKKSQKTD